jgi:hypothetical protein
MADGHGEGSEPKALLRKTIRRFTIAATAWCNSGGNAWGRFKMRGDSREIAKMGGEER